MIISETNLYDRVLYVLQIKLLTMQILKSL